MANTTKRKKLDRTTEDAAPTNQKFICCRCGTAFSRQKGYFPVSHSPMYRGSGYLPMCSDCVENLYDYYRENLGSDREAMRRMCMKLDLYWDDAIYAMVERTSGVQSRVRNYIGKTNIIRYIDKTFDDTLKEDAVREEQRASERALFPTKEDQSSDSPEDTADELAAVDQNVIDFWGAGYPADMYTELERHYSDWTNGKEITDPSARSLYRQISLLEVIIARDSAQGKAIDKNVNALNSLLGSMNLKPSQKKEDADAELERVPLGVWLYRYENKRPLPEIDDELKDVNGIRKYVFTWMGHLCKMLGLKNAYSQLYEDEIEKLRVEKPEYEGDDESFFNRVLAEQTDNGGDVP